MFDKLKKAMSTSGQNSSSYQSASNANQRYQSNAYAPPPHAPPQFQQQSYPNQQSFAPPAGPPPQLSENQLAALRRYDTVLLIDDSGSMEMWWAETRDALMGLVAEAVKWDADGVDCYFFNATTSARGVSSHEAVARIFRTVEPRRSTPTASAMRRITEPYLQALEASKANGSPRPKPVNLIVLTDGAPNRGEEPDNLIIDIARRLDAGRFPPTQFGIQFIQIGDDSEAREALQHLDDSLSNQEPKIRDIVDTTLFEGKIDSAYILKALLGAVNRKIDAQN